MEEKKIQIRPLSFNDDLQRVAELIYKTDIYIYPYWFETLDKCKQELPILMQQEGFIFGLKNIDVAVDESTNEILGVICSYKNNDNLNFNYDLLMEKNERYRFTIQNYIKKVLEEIQNADYAYISNVCVHEKARGLGVAGRMIDYVKQKYKNQLLSKIQLDVLTSNSSAIKAYQKSDFDMVGDAFLGFSDPQEDRPEVISMRSRL